MGRLPLVARLPRPAPRLVNATLTAPGLDRLGKRLAGIAPEREAPVFAEESSVRWWTARGLPEPNPAGPR